MEKLTGQKAHSLKFSPAALLALAAAALYALNIPFSKLLLASVPPVMLAAFLYLGAGAGMALTRTLGRRARSSEPPLTRRELPYVLAMIALDIAAPILLMFGLRSTAAETASLLGSFEIVATAAVALAFFSEKVSRHLWAAIALITLASLLLSLDGTTKLVFSPGALLVLAACVCWGFENNCTRKLSSKSAAEIVTVKGLFSGAGSLLVALLLKETFPPLKLMFAALALGFVAYGLSIFFYIRAQKELGAAKTSVYYAAAPFIGVLFSLVIFRELPGWGFCPRWRSCSGDGAFRNGRDSHAAYARTRACAYPRAYARRRDAHARAYAYPRAPARARRKPRRAARARAPQSGRARPRSRECKQTGRSAGEPLTSKRE